MGQGEAYFTKVVTTTQPPGLTSLTFNQSGIPICRPDARRLSTTGQQDSQSEKWDEMVSRFNTATGHTGTGSRRQTGGAEFVYLALVIAYSGPVTLISKTHGRTHGWVQATLPTQSLRVSAEDVFGGPFPVLDATQTAQLSKYFFSFDKRRMEY